MFDVVEGSQEEEYEKLYEELAMLFGFGERTIFLDGGSETRRATKEHWKEYAEKRNLRFEVSGYVVKVGGWTDGN